MRKYLYLGAIIGFIPFFNIATMTYWCIFRKSDEYSESEEEFLKGFTMGLFSHLIYRINLG